MDSQNTICAIIGVAVPTPKWMCGRLRTAYRGGTSFGHIVPILQGALVRDLLNPQGVLRR
ncbi:MAG: hypothetical protein ACLQUY_03840 [Ktedonobacterales bacterium]